MRILLPSAKPAGEPDLAPEGRLAISPYFGLSDLGNPKTRGRTGAIAAGFLALIGLAATGLIWILRPAAAAPATADSTSAAASAQSATDGGADGANEQSEAVVAATATGHDAANAPGSAVIDYEAQRTSAEDQLKTRLPKTEGLLFRDVKTNLSSADGRTMVDFCGEVNVINPMGAYVGFQRFISSRLDATIEQGASPGDFNQAWRQRCTGAEGPKVWR